MVPLRHGTVTNREEIKDSEFTQTDSSRKIYSVSIQKGKYSHIHPFHTKQFKKIDIQTNN